LATLNNGVDLRGAKLRSWHGREEEDDWGIRISQQHLGRGLHRALRQRGQLVLSIGGWRGSCGVRQEGPDGSVSIADGYNLPDVLNLAWLNNRRRLVQHYSDRQGRPMSHMRDFFDCVKSRQPPVAHAEVAHRSMTVCHAINICMLLKRILKWDPAKEGFVKDPEANRLRSRATRAPWTV
jgi:hypothetical protein